MIFCVWFVFSQYTSRTEFYTYCVTLARLVALPFGRRRRLPPARLRPSPVSRRPAADERSRPLVELHRRDAVARRAGPAATLRLPRDRVERGEERKSTRLNSSP